AEAAAGQEETTEGSRVQEPSEESTGDAPAEEGSDETDSPVEIQPVLVTFISDPETAVVAVYPAATEEVPDPEAIPAQDDGSFLLLPGEYTYNAEAEGYVSAEDVSFTVADTALTLSVMLEAVGAEQASFDQSMTVDGVVITVKAGPGVFPADAVLSVEQVPVYQQTQVDTAVEEVRGEDQNVAVSYTFDIKVVNPETGEEYQPADGQTVGVSFTLAEAADENLTTNVYHVTEEETTGGLTAEALDVTTEITPETGEGTTAAVETDGFSLYTVEFTYNTLKYVMQGDTTVALSEILQEVGLTGGATDVAVSNADLFSASNETGEWIITAHQAFDTAEWMTVTIGGVTYEITVTDDGGITTWNELQTALNAGGTVTLTQDITAGANDSALSVSSGLTVVLDLNGYTIDRGLADSEAQANGNVITNNGTLTISDTSAAQTGAITGGSNT
ncbi:hypothetical protein SAMN04487833_1731, partial [Sarcina sp. DSM 11001]|uniref:hypothetical protein n=1 Tax=Sarcina sp. DSM 11001 TaxID=1798184 RepID=UPI0008889759